MFELMGFISKKISPCVMFNGKLCSVFDMTSAELIEFSVDILSGEIRNNFSEEEKKELSILCDVEIHVINF